MSSPFRMGAGCPLPATSEPREEGRGGQQRPVRQPELDWLSAASEGLLHRDMDVAAGHTPASLASSPAPSTPTLPLLSLPSLFLPLCGNTSLPQLGSPALPSGHWIPRPPPPGSPPSTPPLEDGPRPTHAHLRLDPGPTSTFCALICVSVSPQRPKLEG